MEATSMTTPVEKTVIVDEEVITLRMTRDEAVTLLTVADVIGGDPATSRRKHLDGLCGALRTVDVRPNSYALVAHYGGLYFKTELSLA